MAVNAARPLIVGPSTGPEAPFPLRLEGKVIHGYGRGGKQLGIPTANIPVDEKLNDVEEGVYFGWASLRLQSQAGFKIYPMVMSIGNNPVFGNKEQSAEANILHDFTDDFYGAEMRLLILGFVREMIKYPTMDELIEGINLDRQVARNSLDREAWALREMGKGTLDGSWLVRE
ncbi:hypothetical protein FB45DRAFT_925919 [Roridomyces roridus]|uniref:Riboflavin kinase n=1 Tax=Roridomyces roridus TaxID=1738132 RepID=A0AAD7BKG7_9AGAR|nr:hypothetical protein FB45DRAFT_925919 [Roridomyces roridus]